MSGAKIITVDFANQRVENVTTLEEESFHSPQYYPTNEEIFRLLNDFNELYYPTACPVEHNLDPKPEYTEYDIYELYDLLDQTDKEWLSKPYQYKAIANLLMDKLCGYK